MSLVMMLAEVKAREEKREELTVMLITMMILLVQRRKIYPLSTEPFFSKRTLPQR